MNAVLGAWQTFSVPVCYFLVYCFLGWVVEVAYVTVDTGRLVNRGFLNGPVCPIYGFGMLALLALMEHVGQSVPAQFITGMVVATAVELAGGWVLYQIFHTRWWDYSMYPLNLGGYICLRFSVVWGMGSVVMMRVVHPLVAHMVGWLLAALPPAASLAVALALCAVFAADVVLSAAAAVGLNRYLTEIDALRGRLHVVSDKLTTVIGGNALELDELWDNQRLQLRLAAMEGRDNTAELRAQLSELAQRAAALGGSAAHRGARRLLRAFPDMRNERFAEALAAAQRHARRR